MRQLNQMEVNVISGGNDLDKPLLQASFKDVATMFGIWSGFNEGWASGASMVSVELAGFQSLVGSVIGGIAGAALGGMVSAAAAHYVLPAATNLLTNNP